MIISRIFLLLEIYFMKVLKRIGVTLLILILVIGAGLYYLLFDMNRLPEGDFIKEVESTDGTYLVRAYLVNAHATVSYAVRVELIHNVRNIRVKNIYWQYRQEHASIYWIDDDTVSINNVILNVPNEIYDWRRK